MGFLRHVRTTAAGIAHLIEIEMVGDECIVSENGLLQSLRGGVQQALVRGVAVEQKVLERGSCCPWNMEETGLSLS